MNTILRFFGNLALSVWLGSLVILAFVVAPTVFGQLPRPEAGQVMSLVFSRYYMVAMGAGVIALLAAIILGQRVRWSWDRLLSVLLLCAMLGGTGYTWAWVTPEFQQLRTQIAGGQVAAPGQEDLAVRRDRLHQRSVQLNGGVLAGGVLLTLLGAIRERRGDKKKKKEKEEDN